jgi:hypothetical protein
MAVKTVAMFTLCEVVMENGPFTDDLPKNVPIKGDYVDIYVVR